MYACANTRTHTRTVLCTFENSSACFSLKFTFIKWKKAIRDRIQYIICECVCVCACEWYVYQLFELKVPFLCTVVQSTRTQCPNGFSANCTHELQIGLMYMHLACRWELQKDGKKKRREREPTKEEKEEQRVEKREMVDLGNEKNHTAVNKWHFSASKWASCASDW